MIKLPSRREFFGNVAVAVAGLTLAGSLTLPGCSSNQVTSQDFEKRLEELGYEVLGKKVEDPTSTNYVIFFPEIHGVNNKSIGETIKVLGKQGLFKRIGLENYVGETGENLVDETNKIYSDEKLLHLDPESSFIKFYGEFLRQEFEIPAYGLEDPKIYDLAKLAKDIEFEEAPLGFSDDLERVLKGEKGYALKSIKEAIPRIKSSLDGLGITYDNAIFQDANAWRRFYWKITPQLKSVKIDDRNKVFLEKLQPGDCVPVGYGHIPGLLNGYEGNVFVVSPFNSKTNPKASFNNRFFKKELGFIE